MATDYTQLFYDIRVQLNTRHKHMKDEIKRITDKYRTGFVIPAANEVAFITEARRTLRFDADNVKHIHTDYQSVMKRGLSLVEKIPVTHEYTKLNLNQLLIEEGPNFDDLSLKLDTLLTALKLRDIELTTAHRTVVPQAPDPPAYDFEINNGNLQQIDALQAQAERHNNQQRTKGST